MASVQPIQFGGAATAIPFLLLPETATLFADRARRLRHLASGHAMGDYLAFVATIAELQHQATALVHGVAVPAGVAGQPPLAAMAQRDPVWRAVLLHIVDGLRGQAPQPLAEKLQGIAALPAAELERWGQGYLEGDFAACDIAVLPVVAAALQVTWTAMAGQLDAGMPRPAHVPANVCPACGSLPVGSVIRAGAAEHGLRYLCCATCATQWNMERIRCVNCGDSKDISYYDVEGAGGVVQAEACDACHVYTKLFHMEKNPALDVIADDLATVALDILVGEAGYQRYGMNPFLMTLAD